MKERWGILAAAALAAAIGIAPCAGCDGTSTAQTSGATSSSAAVEQSGVSTADQSAADAATDASDSEPVETNSGEGSATSENASATTDASTSASSSSNASASASSSAVPLVPSPDLLAKSDTASSAAAQTLETSLTFDYTGAYAGLLCANAEAVESVGETVEASIPDQAAALAENAGTLTFASGKLVKLGDVSSADLSTSYGVGATALAVHPGSALLLSASTLESAANGAFGLFATNSASAFANDVTITTSGEHSGGCRTTFGGTLLANGLSAVIKGTTSPALSAANSSYLSVANSTLETEGTTSAVIESTGHVEVDNCVGSANAAPAVVVQERGSALVSNSKLATTATDKLEGTPDSAAIVIAGAKEGAAEASEQDPSVFQATDSLIESTLTTGSLIHLTNTQANVVLSNTRLDFDDKSCRLLTAAGNSVNGWGTAGRNGAKATFAARNQKLKGAVVADSISSLDFYLLEGSRWEGSSNVLANTSGAAVADNLVVSIDATSTWVVTENSTVSEINLASGGRLVDTKGNSVKLVDSNGLTLVDGSSSITITVNDAFSTTVKPSAATLVQSPSVDRTGFDGAYGTSTAFGTNGSSAIPPEEQRVADLIAAVKAWFAQL